MTFNPASHKYDPITHKKISLTGDWNALMDALTAQGIVLDNVINGEVAPPSFDLSNGSDGMGTQDFRVWVTITIYPQTNAGSYLIAYKMTDDTIWSFMTAYPTDEGNTVVQTPTLYENTSYDFMILTLSRTSLRSDFSAIQQITTLGNTVALPVPSNVIATPILNGVLLQFDDLGYLGEHYNIYHNTVDNPDTATLIISTFNSSYTWYVTNYDTDFVEQYFWITSVSRSAVESDKSTVAHALPISLNDIDFTLEMKNWTSNFRMWEDETTYGKFYWADTAQTNNATIAFSDETTLTITKNLTGISYSSGNTYFYAIEGSSTLQTSTTYSDAVGTGKYLVAIVNVLTDRPSTILPFNSYVPTIGAGMIAAKAIRAVHMSTDVISSLNETLLLAASRITLQGAVTLASWQSDEVTTINGSAIKTGSISADKILEIYAEQINITGSVYFDDWLVNDGGTTRISGSNISTGSIVIGKLASTVQNSIGLGESAYGMVTIVDGKITSLASDGSSTVIHGGNIITGTIVADVISSGTFSGPIFSCSGSVGGGSAYISFANGNGILDNAGLTLNNVAYGIQMKNSAIGIYQNTTLMGSVAADASYAYFSAYNGSLKLTEQTTTGHIYLTGNNPDMHIYCRHILPESASSTWQIGFLNNRWGLIASNGLNTNSLTVNNYVYSTLKPDVNDSRDLGAIPNNRWNNGYIQNVYSNTITASNYALINPNGTASRDVYMSGTDGAGQITVATSSIRYKENIEDIGDTSWIYKLRPISFQWKNSEDKHRYLGFIAEEMNLLSPESTWSNSKNQVEGIHYKNLTAPIVAELQKLKNRVDELENRFK
jgi:hypothetical protein